MTNIKVEIAQVPVGHLTIEGLENVSVPQDFYIAVPQISNLFQFLNHNASRDIKALLGAGFQFLKVQSPLNPKAVNAVSLVDFEKILFELTLKGNQIAINMSRSLIGLSLHQLFCDAFNREFVKQQRQEWLKVRQSAIDTRKDFQDAVEDYRIRHKKDLRSGYYNWMHKHATDHL